MTRLELYRQLVALPDVDGYSRSSQARKGFDAPDVERLRLENERADGYITPKPTSPTWWLHGVIEKRGA